MNKIKHIMMLIVQWARVSWRGLSVSALVIAAALVVYYTPSFGMTFFMVGGMVSFMGIAIIANSDPCDIELRARIAEHQAIEDSKTMRTIRDKAERRMAIELLEGQGYKVHAPESEKDEVTA